MSNSTHKQRLRVGTRGSLLAVAQTKMVLGLLEKEIEGLSFEIKTVTTSGDHGHHDVFGAFVKEVEMELINGDVDLAVHSLKDIPTDIPNELYLASIPKRGECRDCLVSRGNVPLKDLPKGAKVGTSSLRREYQLKELRSDLEVVPIHGNIITRMGKIDSGEVDAVVLAVAGLERVGMTDKIAQYFTIDEIMPAVAQGALTIQVRKDDMDTINTVRAISDFETEQAALAERAFLIAVGGGCRLPLGAFAEVNGNNLKMKAVLYNESGTQVERAELKGDIDDAIKIGKELAKELLSRFDEKPL